MESKTGTVKAVSIRNVDKGVVGFLLDDGDKWYNVKTTGNPNELLGIIEKKNIIKFDDEDGHITNMSLVKKAEKEPEFDYVSFEELLNDAYNNGLQSIKTEMISVDFEKKTALFKAIVTTKKGEFEAYGDATQENVGEMIKKHWVRMAETRAISRALRWATNNSKTSENEI